MARSISTIQQQIIDNIRGNTTLYNPTNPDPTQRGLTSTSQVSYWLAWTFIVAVAINLFEQVLDIFTAKVEAQVAQAAPSAAQWTQNKILEFQYSDTNPQVVQVNPDFTVSYPVMDATLQVINQCAIVPLQQGIYLAKVAFNGNKLPSLQVSALTAYLEVINPAGITTAIVSEQADYLAVTGTVFTTHNMRAPLSKVLYRPSPAIAPTCPTPAHPAAPTRRALMAL